MCQKCSLLTPYLFKGAPYDCTSFLLIYPPIIKRHLNLTKVTFYTFNASKANKLKINMTKINAILIKVFNTFLNMSKVNHSYINGLTYRIL